MLSIGDKAGAERYANFAAALFIGAGSLLFVYTVVLWLLGLIDFLGDAIMPGYIWKIPMLAGFITGVLFVATRNPGFKWPTLIIFSIALIAALIEVILLVFSAIGCLNDTHPIPCSSFDVVIVFVLLVGAVISLIVCFVIASSLFSYQIAVRRKVIIAADQAALDEFRDQEFAEDF